MSINFSTLSSFTAKYSKDYTDLLRQLMLMYFHVLPAIDVCLEGFLAIGAHKRSFVTMRNQMPFHTALRREFCVTHRTTVRP